ncbi:MAG: pitrilysin family protein [bacterium]
MTKKYLLSNGIAVIEDPIKEAESFTLLVMVRTGSRNETGGNHGISHFLEHMAFKGTKSFPTPMLLAKELDSLGAVYNAFTSKEYTGYYIRGAKRVFDRSLSIISEMTTAPIILEDEVNKERGTIIEEINMYEDDPRSKIYDYFEESLFEDKLIAQEVIGNKTTVGKQTAKDMLAYRETYYTAGNMVISVAGFIPEGLKDSLEKYFSIVRGSKLEYLKPVLEKKKRINLMYKETQQTHLALGFTGVDFTSGQRDVAKLLSVVCGGNMSSRMFSEVREKRGLAYYVSTISDNMFDAGTFFTIAGINNEKVFEAVELIKSIYLRVPGRITADELNRGKEFMVGMITLRNEDSEQRANQNALRSIYATELESLDQRVKSIEKITLKEINDFAADIINIDKICFAAIGPFKDNDKFAKILDK